MWSLQRGRGTSWERLPKAASLQFCPPDLQETGWAVKCGTGFTLTLLLHHSTAPPLRGSQKAGLSCRVIQEPAELDFCFEQYHKGFWL